MTAAIETSGLVKTFGPTRALDGLDLTVDTGEVHGFLGPNGAGKSTTIRILLGLMRATSGRTILLSSHILAQVENLADRISIVRDGKIVETGALADIRHLGRTTIQAGTTTPVTGLQDLPGVHDARIEDGGVRFSVDGEHLDAAVRHLGGFGIRSLVSHPPTLEELMLRHYGKRHGTGDAA
ncbi:hypothetical protein Misp01_47330 [Microtetraspora sp. NBRC 13810]|uniref:ATP-binding cassette domain-containing protein n=1 Tax=Microtetraspora sp. NBRC 13810 TaxID=3030990 RepID=UPI0024A3A4CF|nr:ATP-binding cassette domain-containing protein [Microtetraspora sp. NBRC 13810]GLW09604.1 hypothetical protein Misp01_47330 [Microtetraspora sp. NBRC 13810]